MKLKSNVEGPKTWRVFIYVNEATEPGREALRLLQNSQLRYSTVPSLSAVPVATWGPRQATGLSRIRALIESLA